MDVGVSIRVTLLSSFCDAHMWRWDSMTRREIVFLEGTDEFIVGVEFMYPNMDVKHLTCLVQYIPIAFNVHQILR